MLNLAAIIQALSCLGATPPCPSTGDQNGDGTLGGADLGAILASWGPCIGACLADLTQDGVVDGADLGALLANWGPVPLDPDPEPYSISHLWGPGGLVGFEAVDVDLDGDLDIVAGHFSSTRSYVMCHVNNGHASFAGIVSDVGTNSALSQATTLRTFDANNDALPDLAFGAGTSLKVCMNLGGGVFAPAISPPTAPGSLLGSIDVNSTGIRVLMKGDATGLIVAQWTGAAFEFSNPIATACTPAYGRAGDVDGDGDEDAVIAGGSTAPFGVQVLRNDNGTLVPTALVPTATRPYGIALADQDGDGDVDILLSRSGSISVLLNDGGGVFSAPVVLTTSASCFELDAGDMNGDARPDVFGLAATSTNHRVESAFNQVATFSSPATDPRLGGSSTVPRTPQIADLDGDCRGEALSGGINGVVILRARANALVRPYLVPTQGGSQIQACVDFDADGYDDLLKTNTSLTAGTITWGNPLQLEGTPSQTSLAQVTSNTTGYTAVDVNSDGRPDVVATSSNAPTYSVRTWINLGGRQMANPTIVALPSLASTVIPMRFDSDGYGDVVAIPGGRLLRGRSDGTMELMGSIAQAGAASWLPLDLDWDGDDDLLIGTTLGRIHVWMNQGGTFSVAPEREFGSHFEHLLLCAVDFDLDGDLDVLEWHRRFNPDLGVGVTVWRNDGFSAGFERLHDTNHLITASSATTADFDGDGAWEVVIGSSTAATVFSIDANGNLTQRHRVPTPGAAGVCVGSLGLDRYLDLALGATSGEAFIVESALPVR